MLKDLEDAVEALRKIMNPSAENFGQLGRIERWEAATRLATTIRRIAPKDSPHRQLTDACLDQMNGYGDKGLPIGLFERLLGILVALRADVEAERLQTYAELLHADVYKDYLEMARDLLDKGFKVPAAVLAGCTLESHLRKLATALGVQTTKDNGEAQRAEYLNTEIEKAGGYGPADKKHVTAWLAIRNLAAHEVEKHEFEPSTVANMIEGVGNLLRRFPA